MRPEIADWPARYFYGGLLRCGAVLPPCKLAPYTVLALPAQCTTTASGSSNNPAEARLVLAVATAVRALQPALTIGLLTFYSAQRELLASGTGDRVGMTVNTVDGFQGSERDVVVISCVRAGPAQSGIGFLADRQRLNVALTRARVCLVVVGDMGSLQQHSDMWRQLVSNAERRGVLVKLQPGLDWQKLGSSLTQLLVRQGEAPANL